MYFSLYDDAISKCTTLYSMIPEISRKSKSSNQTHKSLSSIFSYTISCYNETKTHLHASVIFFYSNNKKKRENPYTHRE